MLLSLSSGFWPATLLFSTVCTLVPGSYDNTGPTAFQFPPTLSIMHTLDDPTFRLLQQERETVF